MTYRNIGIDPNSEKFKRVYRTVIAAVNALESESELEVGFDSNKSRRIWRRRCYEYMRITGVEFTTEEVGDTRLILRPGSRKTETAEPVFMGKPMSVIRDERTSEPELTAEQQAEFDAVMAKVREMEGDKIEEDEDYLKKVFAKAKEKGGSHDDDTGRSESGGDGDNPGTPSGEDSDNG